MSYFYTEINGVNREEVDRRVNDLIGRGFEVVSRAEQSETKTIYKQTDSIGRSKRAFDHRADYQKHTVVMRRKKLEKA